MRTRSPCTRLFALLTPALLLLSLAWLVTPAGPAAAKRLRKVEVCHIPPDNPGNLRTINVSENALPDHLGHGDFVIGEPCSEGIGDCHLPSVVPPRALLKVLLRTVGARFLAGLQRCFSRRRLCADDFLIPIGLEIARTRELFAYAPGIASRDRRRLPTMAFFDSFAAAIGAARHRHGEGARVGAFPFGGLT